jgi:non-specific serine/threonine protein kinase
VAATPPAEPGARIKALRGRLRLSQQQLAARLGVSKLTVLRWEHGRAQPSAAVWEHLGALGLGDEAPTAAVPEDSPALQYPLPLPAGRLIGREESLAAILDVLASARLLTLSGTGGCGKTRLALAAATAAGGRYVDGVYLVELAALTTMDRLPGTVADSLRLREQRGIPLLDTIVAALRPRRLLLVLDNCEHLLAGCAAVVQRLIESCSSVTVFATSREPLGVVGEVVWQVPPLALPPAQPSSLVLVSDAAAVQLFVERATARRTGFQLTEENAAAVAQICRRLDGLPLAIELAAARVSVLAVEQIAARLDDRFRLLVAAVRTAPPRQQTLLATIDWSHALLSGPERVLFRRLSVFAGGFDLAAAEAVGSGAEVSADAVLNLLDALIDKSLVVMDVRRGEARYSLLDSLRAYGRDRLAEAAEVEATLDRHVAYYRERADGIRFRFRSAQQESVLRVAGDLDEYRAALQWSVERGRWADYLAIAVGVFNYWDVQGAAGEARLWLERGLRRSPAGAVPPWLRARALGCLGQALWRQGETVEALRLNEEALAIYRECQDREGIAWTQINLGAVAYGRGEFAAARSYWEDALREERLLGNPRNVATLLSNLGALAQRDGDSDRAVSLLEESVAICRDHGLQAGLNSALTNLADAALARGDIEATRAYSAEVLELAQALGQRHHAGVALGNLAIADYRARDYAAAGERARAALDVFIDLNYRAEQAAALAKLGAVAAATGRFAEAAALHVQALTLRRELADPFEIGDSLLGLARLALVRGQSRRAAHLLSAVDGIQCGGRLPPGPDRYDELLEATRASLPAAVFEESHERGEPVPLASVIDEALAWVESVRAAAPAGAAVTAPRTATGAPGAVVLSPRETEILLLLAGGASNKEIALRLHLSVRTAERHLANAYAKIGARGRADAMRYALTNLSSGDDAAEP